MLIVNKNGERLKGDLLGKCPPMDPSLFLRFNQAVLN